MFIQYCRNTPLLLVTGLLFFQNLSQKIENKFGYFLFVKNYNLLE